MVHYGVHLSYLSGEKCHTVQPMLLAFAWCVALYAIAIESIFQPGSLKSPERATIGHPIDKSLFLE